MSEDFIDFENASTNRVRWHKQALTECKAFLNARPSSTISADELYSSTYKVYKMRHLVVHTVLLLELAISTCFTKKSQQQEQEQEQQQQQLLNF